MTILLYIGNGYYHHHQHHQPPPPQRWRQWLNPQQGFFLSNKLLHVYRHLDVSNHHQNEDNSEEDNDRGSRCVSSPQVCFGFCFVCLNLLMYVCSVRMTTSRQPPPQWQWTTRSTTITTTTANTTTISTQPDATTTTSTHQTTTTTAIAPNNNDRGMFLFLKILFTQLILFLQLDYV